MEVGNEGGGGRVGLEGWQKVRDIKHRKEVRMTGEMERDGRSLKLAATRSNRLLAGVKLYRDSAST